MPTLLEVHYPEHERSVLHRFLVRRIINDRRSPGVVVITNALRDDLVSALHLPRSRVFVAPDGAVLIADEAVGETVEDNTNFMGHFFYNFSVLHCLPQAMGFPGSSATGTVMKALTVRAYALEAGFDDVQVLDIEHPQFRFYKLNP